MIKPEDYRNVLYFWKEKGDFTRLCTWDSIKDEFRQKHPEVFAAYDGLIAARKNFNSVLAEVCETYGEEDEE